MERTFLHTANTKPNSNYRIELSSSPETLSELTDTNSTLVSELNEQGSKTIQLTKQVEKLVKCNNYIGNPNEHSEEIDAITKSSVQRIVKDQLFPLKKFIEDHELFLQHDRTKMAISTLVLAKLNIGNERMARFWNTYKGLVHKQLMETRSSRIMQVKKAFIKYINIVFSAGIVPRGNTVKS